MTPRVKSILLDSGQVAVVLLAAGGLLLTEGVGFLCPMAGVLLFGVVVLRAAASIFRGRIRQRVISLVLVAAFSGVLVSTLVYRSMPEQLFRDYVADPIVSPLLLTTG